MSREQAPLALYFDMDGVLANFDEARDRVLGGAGVNLNRLTELLDERERAFKASLYAAIRADLDFYLNLAPLPEGIQVFEYARRHRPVVLTAGPRFEEGTGGESFRNVAAKKLAWCQRHLGLESEGDFICTTSAEKGRYRGYRPARVQLLIDDRRENCAAWEEQGGRAIWHQSGEQSLAELREVERELGIRPRARSAPLRGARR